MFFKFLLIFVCLHFSANAQEEILIKEFIDGLVEDLPEDLDLSEINERLLYFSKHPINLNQTTPEELKSLFFLSALQVANFFTYLSANGKLIDVLELQAVPGFNGKTIQNLLPFVKLNEDELKEKITVKNLKKFGENDLVIRVARILETQKGFRDLTGSKYLGTPEKLLLRYKYNFSNRVLLSLVAEKDAGEKLNPFLTANLTINTVGFVKRLSIGDYSLQFGQGLTLWSGFGFGKGPDVTSIAKKDDGLKSYSSANEYSFFRGIGAKVSLSKEFELTTFLSSRTHDATVRLNEEGNEIIATLNETGYHRTLNELNSKKTVNQKIYGAVVEYRHKNLNVGVISYQSHYSKVFLANDQPYQIFNFNGKQLFNVGFYYNYAFKNIYFFGEAARGLKRGSAMMNGLLISLSNSISAVMLYRKYEKDYHNFFNQGPAESNGFNENGLYAGINISPSRKWTLSAYADYFRFPWLKFRVDAPSQGYEILAQVSYVPSKKFRATIRYKSELKQQNTDTEVSLNFLDPVIRRSYRADVTWKLTNSIALQNRIEVANYQKSTLPAEFGYLVYQDLSFSPSRSKLSGNFRVGYFNAPSYNSRLYAYEDDILYNFTFGMYNGNGIRNYVNLKYKLLKSVVLWARYALFYYKDTTTVGSGLDEINGNKKSEVKFQLRYQF